jgi:hypothetical protein
VRNFPDGGNWTLRGWYESRGVTTVDSMEQFMGTGFTLADLSAYSVVFVCPFVLREMGLEEYQPVFEEYARLGGGLVLFGQVGQLPGLDIDERLGFSWLYSGHTYRHARITDTAHPVMQGISDLPRAGGVFLDYDNTIAEMPLPVGARVLARELYLKRIALLAFEHGAGRVVAGPYDGLMRPYAPTAINPWDVTTAPISENELQLNAIRWVSGWVDRDGDGSSDLEDNCPLVANPDQADCDGDGIGDACDEDDDGDGMPDDADACPLENPEGADANADGCIDRIEDLPDAIVEVELPSGTENALMSSVRAARAAVERGDSRAARGQLGAFINKVEALRGKKIPAGDADMLIVYARNVIDQLP